MEGQCGFARQAFNFQRFFDFHNRPSHGRKVYFILPVRQKDCMLLGVANQACGGRTGGSRSSPPSPVQQV